MNYEVLVILRRKIFEQYTLLLFLHIVVQSSSSFKTYHNAWANDNTLSSKAEIDTTGKSAHIFSHWSYKLINHPQLCNFSIITPQITMHVCT